VTSKIAETQDYMRNDIIFYIFYILDYIWEIFLFHAYVLNINGRLIEINNKEVIRSQKVYIYAVHYFYTNCKFITYLIIHNEQFLLFSFYIVNYKFKINRIIN